MLEYTLLPEGADVSELPDKDLVAGYRAATLGRDRVFSELFLRYHVRVTRWCAKFTGNAGTAQDIAQDVFVRAFRNLGSYRGDSRFSTWLYVITRNQCMTALDREAGEPGCVTLDGALRQPDPNWLEPYERVDSVHTYERRCARLMQNLTPMEGRVMMLHYGFDVPLADITKSLSLQNKSGAKAYIVSARRKLREITQTSLAAWIVAQPF